MKRENSNNQNVEKPEQTQEKAGRKTGAGTACDNVTDAKEEEPATVAEPDNDKEGKGGESEDDGKRSAEEEIAEWRDKYLRLQAEFDNFRKRTLREKMDLVQSGGSDVLKSILPVLDDVLRAVEASEKSDDIKALREGERLVAQKFTDALRQKNVTEIEALGQDFDPDIHEAVAKFAAGEDKKGKVIDVVQRGYRLGDKVLRFAKVVVGE